MFQSYIRIREAALRLRDNNDGVVSFEYVMVAACVVAAVVAAFGTAGGAGPIKAALSTALTAITAQL
jgi:pilus assembly protein Flp/PilA